MKFPLQLLLLITLLPVVGACQQNAKSTTPYDLAVPVNWTVEHFPIPIEFAPEIPYKGKEDIRFTPGWGAPGDQHWSYAFVWWLEGDPQIDATTLQRDLKMYYAGLVGRNITKRQIPADKVVPTNVVVKKVKTAPNDMATYAGTINMLDYMPVTPITLNCVIHVFRCKAENHTGIYFEVSPKALTDPLWKQFDSLLTVNCGH
jgi:hypothetical protein